MAFRTFVFCTLLGLLYTAAGHAQAASGASPANDERVVVTIDGVDHTAADITRIRAALPQQFQQTAAQFSNREFLEQYRRFLAMAKMAEQEGIHEKEPYRTQLENYRLLYLAQVYTTELSRAATASEEEIQAYYEEHKADFNELRVSAIYVDYNPNATPGADEGDSLSEADAKAKAEDLVAQIRQGADFAALAKEQSDDKDSAAKGGDLGYFQPNASLPAALRQTIFGLEIGQVSDPVKDGGRFYIFKVTERRPQTYEQVKKDVANKVRGMKFIETAKEVAESVDIEYKDEAYLRDGPAQPGLPTVEVTPQNAP